MPVIMTSAARSRGYKNGLICLAGMIVFMLALTWSILIIFKQPLRDAFGIAYIILMAITLPPLILGWIYGKCTSGPLLLDCGSIPNRKLFLANAAIFLFLSLLDSFSFSLFGEDFFNFDDRYNASGYIFSAFWVFMALGRLQFRENGIWHYYTLLKWRKIISYHWEGDTDFTLLLETKTLIPFHRKGALPVAAEHKVAIDELLKKYVG